MKLAECRIREKESRKRIKSQICRQEHHLLHLGVGQGTETSGHVGKPREKPGAGVHVSRLATNSRSRRVPWLHYLRLVVHLIRDADGRTQGIGDKKHKPTPVKGGQDCRNHDQKCAGQPEDKHLRTGLHARWVFTPREVRQIESLCARIDCCHGAAEGCVCHRRAQAEKIE